MEPWRIYQSIYIGNRKTNWEIINKFENSKTTFAGTGCKPIDSVLLDLEWNTSYTVISEKWEININSNRLNSSKILMIKCKNKSYALFLPSCLSSPISAAASGHN